MQGVFANRNSKRDFVLNEIQRRAAPESSVYIASAFFTEFDVVKDMLDKGCRVYIVARLGFPTSPDAIEKTMAHPNAQLRIYTGHAFHPKLYLFDEEVALVGSANLTRAAILTNQEVVVSVESDDPRFGELAAIFDDYWEFAEVPSAKMLADYKALYAQYSKLADAVHKLDMQAREKLGDRSPDNIDRGKRKESKQSIFLASFRRTYQESVAAFKIVRDAYAATGYRKASEDEIPLRLEVDSFISFVRERFATGESWRSAPQRSASEQEALVKDLVNHWRASPWPYFEDRIVGDNYPRLKRVFALKDTVMAASDDELFDALCTLHSFGDRLRFFDGGLPTWRREFAAANNPKRARDCLAHLVFGQGDVIQRMADLLYDPRYQLNQFGRANVQELVGWLNREELPIMNGRTTKVLRWFGSRVTQV